MEAISRQTTAGSLLEQAANAEMQIAGARRARGVGHEATGVGGRKVVAWSPKYEAVFEIIERAIEAVLDPGKPEAVEQATESLGRRAVVTREALRDTEVLPLVQETVDAKNKVIAVGVARLEARNAPVACQTIVRGVYEQLEHLRTRVEAALAHALTPTRLLERIDSAVRQEGAGLATLASVLRRLEGRAETEPVRIDQDLAASQAALHQAEERLRVVAQDSKRTKLFGVQRAVEYVRREVQVTIPRLTNERISQMYLSPLRTRMGDIQRALDDRAQHLEDRLRAIREMHSRLREIRSDELGRLNGRGRVELTGTPPTDAARHAAVDEVVQVVFAAVARELRDLLVWKSPQDRMLDELLTVVRERVDAQAPVPSIDDVLLRDADPEKIALGLDRIIRESDVPVALEAGADQARLRQWRCRVIRVPAGSRVAEAMVRFAGYRLDMFDSSGPPDCIEVIVWQPGISLRDTRLFNGGETAYREERADVGAPPIETLSDAVLRSLTRRTRR